MNNTEIATRKPESLERLAMSGRIAIVANAVDTLEKLDQLKTVAEVKTINQIGTLAGVAENRASAVLESVLSSGSPEPKADTLAAQPHTLVSDTALTVETALARVWEVYDGQSAQWN